MAWLWLFGCRLAVLTCLPLFDILFSICQRVDGILLYLGHHRYPEVGCCHTHCTTMTCPTQSSLTLWSEEESEGTYLTKADSVQNWTRSQIGLDQCFSACIRLLVCQDPPVSTRPWPQISRILQIMQQRITGQLQLSNLGAVRSGRFSLIIGRVTLIFFLPLGVQAVNDFQGALQKV